MSPYIPVSAAFILGSLPFVMYVEQLHISSTLRLHTTKKNTCKSIVILYTALISYSCCSFTHTEFINNYLPNTFIACFFLFIVSFCSFKQNNLRAILLCLLTTHNLSLRAHKHPSPSFQLDNKETCVTYEVERWHPVANHSRYNMARVYDLYQPGKCQMG